LIRADPGNSESTVFIFTGFFCWGEDGDASQDLEDRELPYAAAFFLHESSVER
jgi:hypothetical protein